MIPVMFITDLCDFDREQAHRSERPADRAVEVFEAQTAIWRSTPRNRWACSEIQRTVALVALLLCCTLQFVGCDREQQPSPEIVAEINTLQQQTLAPSSSLQRPARISEHQMSVQADWQIRNSSTTKEYFDWVRQQLGADYQVVSQTESVLTMGKTFSGDTYTLEFKSSPSGSTIDAHLSAMPD